jgi:ferrochelatase
MSRCAIVLFNLGGPDSLDAVRPFLFNLFNDKAIFRLPQPFRGLLAGFVARRRTPIATDIYKNLGGGSPLLPNTEAQASALCAALGGGEHVKVFIAMRYWHPFTAQTVADVQAWKPDEIVLLPLYPQFSTTTTGSSVGEWHRVARVLKLKAPTRTICCYPEAEGFIGAMVRSVASALDSAGSRGKPRLLLSAHGLPQSVVAAGDPYQYQCERTATAIASRLAGPEFGFGDLDWTVCYQSRVGPLKWIGPSTDEEIKRAGRDGVPVVIAPIAFVSEHSETLVEIEIEYRHLAATVGVPYFERVPAVGDSPDFIGALAAIVHKTISNGLAIASGCGDRLCPASHRACPARPRNA